MCKFLKLCMKNSLPPTPKKNAQYFKAQQIYFKSCRASKTIKLMQ